MTKECGVGIISQALLAFAVGIEREVRERDVVLAAAEEMAKALKLARSTLREISPALIELEEEEALDAINDALFLWEQAAKKEEVTMKNLEVPEESDEDYEGGIPPIICEGCGGEINPDYGRCLRC